MNVNANKVGLVLSALLGGWHAIWSLLVLFGWGQSIVDFVLWAHMIHLSYIVGPFDVTASLTLIVLTAVWGYFVGYVATMVWNKVHSSMQ